MVLQELGNKISQALASVNEAPAVDDAVLDECLKAIAAALLQVRHGILALLSLAPICVLLQCRWIVHCCTFVFLQALPGLSPGSKFVSCPLPVAMRLSADSLSFAF